MSTTQKIIKSIKDYFFIVALACFALVSSAYTYQKSTITKPFEGEIYVNTTENGDYIQLDEPFSESNCQDESDYICSYERTSTPGTVLPSFDHDQAQEYVADDLLTPVNPNRNGIYPMTP